MRQPHVVIIGSGFGGLYAARALRDAPVDVTVIDRTNHHVFQPLLYQVATATLTPTDIAAPIRWLLRSQTNAEVLLADVTEILPDARPWSCARRHAASRTIFSSSPPARGTRTSATPDWEARAPGLKSIEDAIELRRRWLLAFERAERDDRSGRARRESDVRHHRRRPDGRRAGRNAADDRALCAADGLPSHRHGRRADHSARGRSAAAADVSRGPVGARARRDLTELGVDVRTSTFVTSRRRRLRRGRRRAHRRRARSSGRRATRRRRSARRSACRAIGRVASS